MKVSRASEVLNRSRLDASTSSKVVESSDNGNLLDYTLREHSLSDLITELQRVKSKYGDLSVASFGHNGSIDTELGCCASVERVEEGDRLPKYLVFGAYGHY